MATRKQIESSLPALTNSGRKAMMVAAIKGLQQDAGWFPLIKAMESGARFWNGEEHRHPSEVDLVALLPRIAAPSVQGAVEAIVRAFPAVANPRTGNLGWMEVDTFSPAMGRVLDCLDAMPAASRRYRLAKIAAG